jgi:hypothetical protein
MTIRPERGGRTGGDPEQRGPAARRRRTGDLHASRRGSLYYAGHLPILRDMTVPREIRRPHVEWWIVAAWSSLALVVVAGLAAATGTF